MLGSGLGEGEGTWAEGQREETPGTWRVGRVEHMLPFLAGPGLGSERRGPDSGRRPVRPAGHGPLSLLYALRLSLAPPLPRL